MRILAGAFIASLFFAGTGAAQELPAQPVPYTDLYAVPASAPAEGAESSAERPVLAQTDPVWCRLRLGRRTVCESGCLAVSIVDGVIEKGFARDPLALLRTFILARAFTRDGLFVWSALPRVIPGLALRERNPLHGVDAVEANIQADRIVIVKIDRSPNVRGVQQHFVRAIGTEDGDIVVRDPGRRRQGSLTSIYGSSRIGIEYIAIGKG